MIRRWTALLGLLPFLTLPASAQNNRFSAQPVAGNTSNASIGLSLFTNESVTSFAVTGLTASGGSVLTIEGSADGKNTSDSTKTWFSVTALSYACPATTFTTVAADGPFKVDTSGLTNVRVRVSTTGSSPTPMLVSGYAMPGTVLSSCNAATGSAFPTGSAGTPNAAVASIQGVVGGTPVPVSGTFSATIGGWAPTPAYTAAMAVTSTTSRIALPSNGGSIQVYNVGAKTAYFTVGNGSVTATTAEDAIQPGATCGVSIGAAVDLAAITGGSDTTTLNISGGAGLVTGCSGGGGGAISGATQNVAITSPLGHATADAAAVSIVPSATASFPATLNTTPTLANGNGVVPTQGGAVISATNGIYSNILQGNAVISATNGLYSNLLQGNAVVSATNPVPANLSIGGAVVSATNGEYANLLQGNAVISNSNPVPHNLSIAGAAVSATNGEYTNILQGNAVISATNGLYTNLLQGNAAVGTSNPIPVSISASGVAITATSNNLNVQCANCSGSGVSAADGASWTVNTSLLAPTGGFYQTTATSNPLTAGTEGTVQMTHYRAFMTDWYNSSGTEMGTSGSPVQVSLANTAANATPVSVNIASGNVASGAVASGAFASGSISSGAIASGALAAGSISSGAAVSGAFADGSIVTIGAKADAKSTATDTTAITAMQVLKEISFMEQTPASRAVTNAGTFAVQLNSSPSLVNGNGVVQTQGGAVLSATNGEYANILQGNAVLSGSNPIFTALSIGGAVNAVGNPIFVSPGTGASFTVSGSVTANAGTNLNTSALALESGGNLATTAANTGALGAKTDAKNTATDTTSVSAISVLKEISAMAQAPASTPVTNAGTFATQLTGSTNNINNISGTVSLPTGAATSANQPSIIAVTGSATSGTNGTTAFGAVTTSAPTYTTGNTFPLSLDLSGNLRVVTSGAATAANQTNASQKTQIVDGSGNVIGSTSNALQVDCTIGCSGGSFNNNSDAVATSAINGQVASWLYGFNGTTWDRLRSDSNKYLNVDVQTGVPSLADKGTFTQSTTLVAPIGGEYNSAPTALASGQAGAMLMTPTRFPLMGFGATPTQGTAWPSGTTSTTTQAISDGNSMPVAWMVQLDQGSGISAGAITIQASADGGANWSTVNATQVIDPTSASNAAISLPYTLVASTNKAFLVYTRGYQLRLEVSTTTSGGTVTPYFTPLSADDVMALLNAINSGVVTTGATAAPVNVQVAGVYNSSPPTPSSGQAEPLQLDSSGRLIVTAPSSNPVNVTVNTPPNDVTTSATNFTGAGTLVVSSQGSGAVGMVVTGTYTGANWTLQGSVDGTNYATIPFWNNTSNGTIYTAQPGTSNVAGNGTYVAFAAGYKSVRLNVTAVSTGTLTATLNASAGSAQHPISTQGVNANINGVNGQAPATAASGTLKVGVVGNAGGAFDAATGAAPPANALYLGANASGATGGHVAGLISCDSHTFQHITSATDTLFVQGVASQQIYVCGWRSRAAGTATWYFEDTASTNANCTSAKVQLNGVATEAANTGETILAPFWTGMKMGAAGRGLCANSTGTGGVDVDVWYTQF